MTLTVDDLRMNFGRIWPLHVQEFTELLIDLRRHFDGDLDLMLILALIGSRTAPASRLDGVSYAEFAEKGAARADFGAAPINVQSVAECSGIPRETVRRKVQKLEELGWVERQENGRVAVLQQAREALAPATEASLRYLAAIGGILVDISNEV